MTTTTKKERTLQGAKLVRAVEQILRDYPPQEAPLSDEERMATYADDPMMQALLEKKRQGRL
jgi:hypothetical protein